MQFESNRALVKADVQAKRVTINVDGPAASRRRLLAVIRADFDHIHHSFTFEPQAMIPVPEHPEMLIPYKKFVVLETKGITTYQDVVGDDVLELDVQAMLNGVDLEGTRRSLQTPDRLTDALRLFYSYAHEDENLRDALEGVCLEYV